MCKAAAIFMRSRYHPVTLASRENPVRIQTRYEATWISNRTVGVGCHLGRTAYISSRNLYIYNIHRIMNSTSKFTSKDHPPGYPNYYPEGLSQSLRVSCALCRPKGGQSVDIRYRQELQKQPFTKTIKHQSTYRATIFKISHTNLIIQFRSECGSIRDS